MCKQISADIIMRCHLYSVLDPATRDVIRVRQTPDLGDFTLDKPIQDRVIISESDVRARVTSSVAT